MLSLWFHLHLVSFFTLRATSCGLVSLFCYAAKNNQSQEAPHLLVLHFPQFQSQIESGLLAHLRLLMTWSFTWSTGSGSTRRQDSSHTFYQHSCLGFDRMMHLCQSSILQCMRVPFQSSCVWHIHLRSRVCLQSLGEYSALFQMQWSWPQFLPLCLEVKARVRLQFAWWLFTPACFCGGRCQRQGEVVQIRHRHQTSMVVGNEARSRLLHQSHTNWKALFPRLNSQFHRFTLQSLPFFACHSLVDNSMFLPSLLVKSWVWLRWYLEGVKVHSHYYCLFWGPQPQIDSPVIASKSFKSFSCNLGW